MNSHIPSDVRDAISKLAEFIDQHGYAEANVTRTGSASFTRHRDREKEEDLRLVRILATIAAAILFVSSFVIILIHLFKPLPELTDGRWMLILIGSSVLSAMVTVEPSLNKKEMRGTNIVMATFATFIFLGLSLLSTSPILSTLFYGMAFSCCVFGQGFNVLEKGLRRIQRFVGEKYKAV